MKNKCKKQPLLSRIRQAGHAPTLQQQVLAIMYMPKATSLTQSFTLDHTVVYSILL